MPRHAAPASDRWEGHFRPVGLGRGGFRFVVSRGRRRQTVTFDIGAMHDLGTLLALAPLSFWRREFPSGGWIDLAAAADALISECYRAGGVRRAPGASGSAGR